MTKFSLALLTMCVIIIPMTSDAFVVSDPVTELNTALTYGQTVLTVSQLITQAITLNEQLTQLKAAIETLTTGQYNWSNAQAKINELANLVSQANGLAYSASNLDGQFKKLYPGYAPPSNYQDHYTNMVNTSLNTINGVMQTMGMSAQDFQVENTRLAFLQAQAQHAKGQTQALQAAAQIASEQVSQLQLLRQTLLSQSNAQGTYYAAQLQKEASANAEVSQIIANGATTAPTIGHSGYALELPNLP